MSSKSSIFSPIVGQANSSVFSPVGKDSASSLRQVQGKESRHSARGASKGAVKESRDSSKGLSKDSKGSATGFGKEAKDKGGLTVKGGGLDDKECHSAVAQVAPADGPTFNGLFAKCQSHTFILTEQSCLPDIKRSEHGKATVGGPREGHVSKKHASALGEDVSGSVSASITASMGNWASGSFLGGGDKSAKDKQSGGITGSMLGGGLASSMLGGGLNASGVGGSDGMEALEESSEDMDAVLLDLDPETLFVADDEFKYSIVACNEGDHVLPHAVDLADYTIQSVPPVGTELYIWEHTGTCKKFTKCKIRRVADNIIFYMVMAAAPAKKKGAKETKGKAEPQPSSTDILGLPGTPVYTKCEGNSGYALLALQRRKEPSGLIQGLLVGPMVRSIEVRLVLSSLHGSLDVADAQEHDLINLRKLTVHDPKSKALVVEHGGVKILRSTLIEHEDSKDVLQQACAVLRNLACDENNQIEIADNGLVKYILKALSSNTANIGLEEQVLGLLGNLACADECKQLMLEVELLEQVFALMAEHPDSAALHEQAVGLLWNLGINDRDIQHQITHDERFDGIHQICASMEKHMDKAGMQSICSGALANLVTRDQAGKRAAAEKGAIKRIIAGMKRHSQEVDVQRQACAALWSLTANCAPNQAIAVEENAIEIVLEAMDLLDSAEVQENACGALRNLTAFSSENKERARTSDAVDKIATAMSEHRDHLGLQKQACGALWNLAAGADAEAINAICEGQAIEEICEAIVKHGQNISVLENGCGALRNICTSSNDARDATTETQVLPTICQLMKSEPTNATLQRVGFEFIASLAAGGPEYCESIFQAGAITVICDSMRANLQNPVVLERGCACLRRCAAEDSVQEAIVEDGGIELLCNVMSEHEDATLVQRQACSMLECLAGKHGTRWKLLEKAGALRLVTGAMAHHPLSALTQEMCCRVLRACCRGGEAGVKAVIKVKAIDLVSNALTEHLQSPSMQEQGCGVLLDVSCTDEGRTLFDKMHDTVRQAIKALEAHSSHEACQNNAVEFLKNLAVESNPRMISVIVNGNGVKRVCMSMMEQKESEAVNLVCCELLHRLATRDNGRDRVLNSEALERVCECMQRHIHSLSIQRSGMCVFSHFLGDPLARQRVGEAGGILRLSEATKAHGSDILLQQDASKMIGDLVDSLAVNQEIAARVGVIDHVSQMMAAHEKNLMVQCVGCDVFCSLAVGSDSNKELIVNAGGLKVICKALEEAQEASKRGSPAGSPANPGSPAGSPRIGSARGQGRAGIPGSARFVSAAPSAPAGGSPRMDESRLPERLKVEAITALWCVSVGDKTREAIIQSKAISLVCELMDAEPRNAKLQGRSCGALASFAGKAKEGQEAVAEKNGIALVCKAMDLHLKEEAVQECGCSALCNMGAKNVKMKTKISEAQGIQRICDAMETHRKSARVQSHACAALWNLASGVEKNKEEIVQRDGIVRVLTAMNVHKADSVIARHACETLASLAVGNPKNAQAIQEAEAIPKICHAMSVHSKRLAVQQQGMNALANIAYGDFEIKSDVKDAGGVQVICAAMEAHPKDMVAQEFGCWALANLAVGHPEMKQTIVNSGARDLIDKALRVFGTNHTLQTIGYAALRRLEGFVEKEDKKAAAGGPALKFAAGETLEQEEAQQEEAEEEDEEEESEQEGQAGRGSLFAKTFSNPTKMKRFLRKVGLRRHSIGRTRFKSMFDEASGEIISVPVISEQQKRRCCTVM